MHLAIHRDLRPCSTVIRFGNRSQGPADDPDRDGLTNLQELIAETDPTVSNLELSIELIGDTIKLDWLGVLGRLQILEETLALEGTGWVPVWTNDLTLPASVTIPMGTNATKFYRLRLEE